MENIAENINWLITVLTFLGGIYMYFNHTYRLNQQQKKLNEQQEQLNKQQVQLNEYQIEKSKAESLEKKQAMIEANVYRTTDRKGNSIWKMKIYNKGKAKATNIDFTSETLDADSAIELIGDPTMFPIPSLIPYGSVELSVLLCCGHKPSHKFIFTWDDESGKGRAQEQDVFFQ